MYLFQFFVFYVVLSFEINRKFDYPDKQAQIFAKIAKLINNNVTFHKKLVLKT